MGVSYLSATLNVVFDFSIVVPYNDRDRVVVATFYEGQTGESTLLLSYIII